MALFQVFLDLLPLILAVGAAAFTYFRFFREGPHRQRIQFDIDYRDLGVFGDDRIVEIGCTAANKGNVEQRFDDIRVTVRAIKPGDTLKEIAGREPRLAFPVLLKEAPLIPKKYPYFFVRPGVEQRFPLLLRISASFTHVHVRCTFKYKGTDDVHSAERAFSVASFLKAGAQGLGKKRGQAPNCGRPDRGAPP